MQPLTAAFFNSFNSLYMTSWFIFTGAPYHGTWQALPPLSLPPPIDSHIFIILSLSHKYFGMASQTTGTFCNTGWGWGCSAPGGQGVQTGRRWVERGWDSAGLLCYKELTEFICAAPHGSGGHTAHAAQWSLYSPVHALVLSFFHLSHFLCYVLCLVHKLLQQGVSLFFFFFSSWLSRIIVFDMQSFTPTVRLLRGTSTMET